MKTLFVVLFAISLSVINNFSRAESETKLLRFWKEVKIPGAKCGNGKPYSVWIDQRNPEKLAVEFMGGGACWSKETCYGPNYRAWLFPVPRWPLISMFSASSEKVSPAYDHTMIYLPYCTADVYTGTQVANYKKGKKTYHWGHLNTLKTFEYLREKKLINFKAAKEFVLYGASAGALGSFIHGKMIAELLPENVTKTLIADSPGLHYGKTFWKKFPERFLADVKNAFVKLGLEYDENDGNVAQYLGKVCNNFPDWNIGIMQGSRDIVMSWMFGEITQDDHENLIYGNLGVWEATSKSQNCSVWLPRSAHHAFLIFAHSAVMESDGKKGMDFVRDIISGKQNINYRY